jgi:hypothetical protein
MSLEIAQYAAAVGAALADLPENTRNELLEDLPAHLAEVAAEVEAEGGTLQDRLGSPAAYAAELRATVGHDAPASRGVRLSAATAKTRARLRAADTRLGKLIGYAKLSEFVKLLRPAWWVLRGYLAAWLICEVVSGGAGPSGALPRLGDNVFGGVVVTVGLVIGSIWLGHTAVNRAKLWQRVVIAGVTAGLALFGFGLFVTIDGELAEAPSYYEGTPSQYIDASWQNGGDLVVVDSAGRVLDRVAIVDLNNESYVDAKLHNCGTILSWEFERWPLLARLCRQQDGMPIPSPTAQPSLTPSAAPTATAAR